MTHMFSKAAVVLAVAAVLPWTTCAAATSLGVVTGTTPWTQQTAAGSFDDLFNFSVASNNGTGIAATTVSFSNYGAVVGSLTLYSGTYATTAELVGLTPIFLSSSSNTMVSPTGTITTTVAGTSGVLSTAETYTLRVGGTSDGTAAYVGVIALTPVPEPETYAMLAAGLGMMGMMIRRRRNQ